MSHSYEGQNRAQYLGGDGEVAAPKRSLTLCVIICTAVMSIILFVMFLMV